MTDPADTAPAPSTPEAAASWDLYRNTRDRFVDLARSLDADQAATTIPITPGWTVAEALAHVCGLNADVAAGMREGLGTDERTAHQVNTRAGMTVAEICDEWLGHAAGMITAINEDPMYGRRLGADLVVHLHDVQHALGFGIDTGDEATISGGRTYGSRIVDVYADAANVNLDLDLGEHGRFQPSAPAADAINLRLQTTPYDFLRSVTGRRSAAEIRALNWSGDPEPLLAGFSPYGPLRTEDAGF